MHFQWKTITKNWQQFSKLLPSRSYSSSYLILCWNAYQVVHEVTEVPKNPEYFDFFSSDNNRVDVCDDYGSYINSTILIFKVMVRFQKNRNLSKAFVHPELDPTPLLHTPQRSLLGSPGLGALFRVHLTSLFYWHSHADISIVNWSTTNEFLPTIYIVSLHWWKCSLVKTMVKTFSRSKKAK